MVFYDARLREKLRQVPAAALWQIDFALAGNVQPLGEHRTRLGDLPVDRTGRCTRFGGLLDGHAAKEMQLRSVVHAFIDAFSRSSASTGATTSTAAARPSRRIGVRQRHQCGAAAALFGVTGAHRSRSRSSAAPCQHRRRTAPAFALQSLVLGHAHETFMHQCGSVETGDATCLGETRTCHPLDFGIQFCIERAHRGGIATGGTLKQIGRGVWHDFLAEAVFLPFWPRSSQQLMIAGSGCQAGCDMSRQILTNLRLFDSLAGVLRPVAAVVVADGRVEAVIQLGGPVPVVEAVDLVRRGRAAGAHRLPRARMAVHHDAWQLSMQPPTYITAQATHVLEGMLLRATTVRDAAGADYGCGSRHRARFHGPRCSTLAHHCHKPAGMPTSGRVAPANSSAPAPVSGYSRRWPNVLEAARGARAGFATVPTRSRSWRAVVWASPTDPIDGTQYSLEELTAICEETTAANTYAMAHAYSPRSITRAVQCGVRTIEHGNLLDEASAKVMKQHGAFLVPTLATYAVLGDEGKRLAWSDEMLAKLDRAERCGNAGHCNCHAAGVPIGFGTDLLGSMHPQQARVAPSGERADPGGATACATSVAATVLNQEGKLGVIAPGAYADLIVVDGDLTQDITVMCEPERNFVGISTGNGRRSLPADWCVVRSAAFLANPQMNWAFRRIFIISQFRYFLL